MILSLSLLQGSLRCNDSPFLLLAITSVSEKQCWFYKAVVYRTSEIIPRGPLRMNHQELILNQKAWSLTDLRLGRPAGSRFCFTRNRGQEEVAEGPCHHPGKVNGGGSRCRSEGDLRSNVHKASVVADGLNVFTPGLIPETKLLDWKPGESYRGANPNYQGWNLRKVSPIPPEGLGKRDGKKGFVTCKLSQTADCILWNLGKKSMLCKIIASRLLHFPYFLLVL